MPVFLWTLLLGCGPAPDPGLPSCESRTLLANVAQVERAAPHAVVRGPDVDGAGQIPALAGPDADGGVWGMAEGGVLFHSADQGCSWTAPADLGGQAGWEGLSGGDVLRFVGIDTDHLAVSRDQGHTWSVVQGGMYLQSPPWVDPADPDHLLYLDTQATFHRSRDGGASWQQHARAPVTDAWPRGQWAVDRHGQRYALTGDGTLWVSLDGGARFETRAEGSGPLGGSGWAMAPMWGEELGSPLLYVLSQDLDSLALRLSGSRDGGESWRTLWEDEDTLQTGHWAADPEDPGLLVLPVTSVGDEGELGRLLLVRGLEPPEVIELGEATRWGDVLFTPDALLVGVSARAETEPFGG